MKQTILIILDGLGLSPERRGNALALAKTPNLDYLKNFYPAIPLQASGIAVGLPWGEAGNSEVGHLTIGGGRTVYQSLPRIVMAIQDGSFFLNPVLVRAINHVRQNNSTLHLMGLASSGSVHAYIDHLYALIELAKREKIKKLRLHLFTDGEDAPPREALTFLTKIEAKLKELPDAKFATIIGRIYSMDRNRNWDRTEKAYHCLVDGQGRLTTDWQSLIKQDYQQNLTDTFIEPIVLTDEHKQPLGSIAENDAVIFFNFRKDRAHQLAEAFAQPNFKAFSVKKMDKLFFATMIDYSQGQTKAEIIFPPISVPMHLTETLAKYNSKVLKIAETEKYAHVTYFFNGGVEKIYPNEKRILVSSTTSARYDEFPQMSASVITQNILQALDRKEVDLIVANYANADIIGHTGDLPAAIKAVESLDVAIGSLLKTLEKNDCQFLITADHGNAEQMIDLRTGEPFPEHTTNPVPCFLVTKNNKKKRTISGLASPEPQGILSDIAPTLLQLMNLPQPKEMSGQSLLPIINSV